MKNSTNQSWFGLLMTKLIRLSCIFTNLLIDFTFGLFTKFLKVIDANIGLLALYVDKISQEVKDALTGICEKTSASKDWIDSFTGIIMFIPNCIVSLLSSTVSCAISLFDVVVDIIALPPTICLKLVGELVLLIQHYMPGEDLYNARLYEPKGRCLNSYTLLQEGIVVKQTPDYEILELHKKVRFE